MARKTSSRTKSSDHGATTQKGDWKHVVSVTAVIGGVLGALILGAVLQADPEQPPAVEPRSVIDAIDPGVEPPQRIGTEEAAALAPPEPAPMEEPSLPSAVTDRVSHDLQRLTAGDSGWMLQVMAACDEANVQRMIDRIGASEQFHVLPARLDDRPCYRVCWGPFRGRSAALAAIADLPGPLRSLPGTPTPKPVADLLP
jgi:septal ring-binding cell division protein DamX